MQFIFAKDSAGGHELLYSDGRGAVAERLAERLSLKGNIDVFGYIAPGLNGTHAIFFRAKNDKDDPYGAYFVHGVSRDATPEYFGSESFKNDLFTRFIGDKELRILRSEETALSAAEPDEQLLSYSEKYFLDKRVTSAVISHIFSGDKLALIVPDDAYSVAYGRLLAEYVMRYMPPSCRALCSFLVGADDEPAVTGLRFRIVKKDMLADPGELYVNIADADASQLAGTRFDEVSDGIVGMTDEERHKFFMWFETLSGGFQSKKLLDFWEAYRGDAGAAERLLNAHLAACPLPSLETIPPFISELVGKNYGTEAVADREIFRVGSTEDIIMPSRVLEESSVTIKKLWLYNEYAEKYISLVFRRAVGRITLDDEALTRIREAVSARAGAGDPDRAPYRECFYAAVEHVYDQLRARTSEYFAAKSAVFDKLDEAFSVDPERIITVGRMNMLLSAIEKTCESKGIADVGALTDAAVDEFYAMLSDHEKKCESIYGAPVHNIDVDESAVTNLSNIRDKLDSRNIFELAELILAVDVQFRDYPELVNAQAAKYAVIAGDTVLYGNDKVFATFMHTPGRMYDVAARAASYDAWTAALLLAAYDAESTLFPDTVKLISTYRHAFDTADAQRIAEYDKKLGEMLKKRVDGAGAAAFAGSDGPTVFYTAPTAAVGSAVLLRTVEKIWEGCAMPKKNKFLAAVSKDPVPFVCGAVIVGSIILMVIIILICGHFGKKVGEAAQGYGTTAGGTTSASDITAEPGSTSSDATEPSETEPEETEPKETEPDETEPEETEPKETKPKETEPKETEPKETEPKETKPKETEPKETEPETTEPEVTEPEVTEPETTEPEETEPETTEPDGGESTAADETTSSTPENKNVPEE